MSRLESNKEARLTGQLIRFDGSDFMAQQIESMIYEFQRILPGYVIVGDLDNWSFSSDHITFHGSNEEEEEEDNYAEESESEIA